MLNLYNKQGRRTRMNQSKLSRLCFCTATVLFVGTVFYSVYEHNNSKEEYLQEVIDEQAEELYNKDNELGKRDIVINDLRHEVNLDEEKLASCPKWVPMQMELSFYTVSADECGNDAGITSSGTIATVGRTIASNTLPQGTKVMIDDHVYTVEDTGGNVVDSCLDILVSTKEEAFRRGRYMETVYVLREG